MNLPGMRGVRCVKDNDTTGSDGRSARVLSFVTRMNSPATSQNQALTKIQESSWMSPPVGKQSRLPRLAEAARSLEWNRNGNRVEENPVPHDDGILNLRAANRRRLMSLVALCAALTGLSVCCAEPAAPAINPRQLGFDIPAGPLRVGAGRRVTTNDNDGKPVVAKIHVEVGEHRIVMLPDGRLVARSKDAAPDTERAFKPSSKDEIKSGLSESFENFMFMPSGRYLFVYNTTDGFAKTTSRIMRNMYRGVELHASAQKIKTHPPEVPLVVIMFRTEAEFQKHRRMPAGVVAYYDVLSNQVVLYEEARLTAVSPEVAVGQKISTIAHEGAHQILHNIGVQQRLSVWPMWLAEGLAEYFAPTSFGERLTWKGAGQVNDLRMYELEEYLQGKSANGLDGKTIQQTVMAARLTSTGYASAWSLTHFLAKNHRADFNAYVLRMSRLGPLQGYLATVGSGLVSENLTLFKKHFGDDLVALERRQVKHLQRLPYKSPFAARPHFVVTISYPDGRRVAREANLFHTSANAQRWQAESLAKVPADKRGRALTDVKQFQNRALAVRYRQKWLNGN